MNDETFSYAISEDFSENIANWKKKNTPLNMKVLFLKGGQIKSWPNLLSRYSSENPFRVVEFTLNRVLQTTTLE